MEHFADELLGAGPPDGKTPPATEDLLLSELVAASAGYAVNCPICVSVHMAEMRRLGGTADQIQVALGMARAVKHQAEQHAQAAWDEATGSHADPGTGCGAAGDGGQQEPVATGCGCSEAGEALARQAEAV